MSTRSRVLVLLTGCVAILAACTPDPGGGGPTSYPVPYFPIASAPVAGVETVTKVACHVGLPPALPEGAFVDVRTSHHTRVTFRIDDVPSGTADTFPDPLHSGSYERTPSPRVLPGSCLTIVIEDHTGLGPFTAILAWYSIIV